LTEKSKAFALLFFFEGLIEMNKVWRKLYTLNLLFISSFVFSERPVDNSRRDKHGTDNSPMAARPVNSSERTSCLSTDFDKKHGTFELSDHQKSYEINQQTYIFSNRPPVPESTPLPLIEIEKEGTTSIRYPVNRGGIDHQHPIETFNLVGWSYKAPQDSTFRTALSQGLECLLTQKEDFGDKLEKILSDESIFKRFRGVSSKKDSEKEAPEAELAKARKMLEVYRELKKEISDTKNNLLIKNFLAAVFSQIKLTEEELRRKINPISFEPTFIKQLELLHNIKGKTDPSQQEKEILSYFENQFSKEPRFSYLMNPLITSFVKTAIENGVRNPESKTMQAEALKDFEEHYLRKNVGKEFYGLSPTDLASKMFYDPKKKEIEILSPEPFRRMDETIKKRISEIQTLEPKEQRSKVQELEQSIVGALTSLDSEKYGPSPQMHALRQSLVRGLTQLAGDTQEAVHRINELSATAPRKLESDSNLLSQLGKKAGLSLSNEALVRFSKYDPVLKRVLSGVLNRIPSFGENQKEELNRILQSGSSTDIMHALMMPYKGFHKAAVEELEAMGADKEAISLLKELSDHETMNSRQGEEYYQLRDRLKKEILVGEFSDTSFAKLSDKQKADLFVLAMLDEHGLRGVTPRDGVSSENRDHYDLGALYSALNSEDRFLNALSRESGKSQEVLENEMKEHVTRISGKWTGLPPQRRQTILDRINGRPSSHLDNMAVPSDTQMELLSFAGRVAKSSSGNSQTERLAQANLQKLLMLPVTQETMDKFVTDHTGPEALRFYRPAGQYDGKKDGFGSLYENGFFDHDRLKDNVDKYGSYAERLGQERQKLAEGILDFARAKLESEVFKMRTEQGPDPKKAAQLEALSGLIENYLTPAVKEGSKLDLIEHLANDLLGNPNVFDSKIADLFPTADPKALQATMRSALDLLKKEGVKQHLGEKLSVPLETLKAETRKWRELFEKQFKDLSIEDRALAEETLADFQRYGRALSGNYQASFRNPADSVPKYWVQNAKQFFREFENVPRLMANFEEGSESHKKVNDALLRVASNVEKKAEEQAKSLQAKQKSVIAELTDSEGKFKQNHIGYDPALNMIVIGKDSLIDQTVVDKLSELKNYNLFLESEGQVITANGQQGLEDWIREQRFKYGYSEASTKDESGKYLAKGEVYLPLNDRTAVKVFRGGDGTYRYQFEDAAKIQTELEANKARLVQRRSDYLNAQEDFKSGVHAARAYFGNLGNWGFWDSTTPQEKKLNSTYSEMMTALERVGEAGHVEDATGMSGKARVERNRDAIQHKHLKDEMAAIESFVNKVDTIHDLTVTLVTLPAGNLIAARLAVAANSVKGTTAASRAMARALLTTARAAKAYTGATKAALGTAGTFTAYGYGIEVGATALESWWGNGPKMIRAKEELYNKGKPWRKYADGPPFEGDFKGDKEAYHKALGEYEIEEAMDPDHDGVPNNHDSTGLNITLDGKQTAADLLWSPVEQFAGNAKFFQGLNIAKAAPGLARLGLPGEMAFAPLWTKFNPFFDPGLEKLKREEQKRREYVEHQTKSPERERSLIEKAGREMGMGAVEGFRFGASGIPTKMLMGALPKNSLSLALGTLAFIATDEASKYALNSAMEGKFRSPFENPEWKKEMAHSFVIGGYIGYGMAKGGQQSNYYSSLKEKIGILDKRSETRRESGTPKLKSISELVEKDFQGDEGQALLFLRTITDKEIDSAPLHIQTEFFRLMKQQGKKAVEEVRKFVQETGREDLKIEGAKLAKSIPEITALQQLTQSRTLTPEEGARLQELRLEQDLAFFNLQQAIEPLKKAADKAKTRMAYLSKNLVDLSPKQKKQYEADQRAIKEYSENGARIHEAIIRMDTVKNFQGPVLMRTSVLSPDSKLAEQMLRDYPEAQKALREDQQRRTANPSAWEQTLRSWKYLEDEHIAPNLSLGGTWWHGPQGFDGQNRMASITIQSVRNRSASAETRSQLLDLLRVVDPKTAVNIERKEGK
jgi:hypothetical protein